MSNIVPVKSNGLASRSPIGGNGQITGGLRIESIDDLNQLGALLSKSGFFPDCRDAAQAAVKILAGIEIGVSAFSAMGGIHIIKGKASIGAKLLAAKIKASKRYNYKVLEHTAQVCRIQFYENGQECGISEFSIDDAKNAGLLSNPTWKAYPRNMLFARAIANGQAFYCPDVLMGGDIQVMAEEELDDRSRTHPQSPAAARNWQQSDVWINFQKDIHFAISTGDRNHITHYVNLAYQAIERGELPIQARTAIEREEERALDAIASMSATSMPISVNATSDNQSSRIDRLSKMRRLTGHTSSQVKPIAGSIGLEVGKAAQWTGEECDRFRDALFLDFAARYDVFKHPNHCTNAYGKVLNSFESAPTDEQLFDAWKADLDRRKAEAENKEKPIEVEAEESIG